MRKTIPSILNQINWQRPLNRAVIIERELNRQDQLAVA